MFLFARNLAIDKAITFKVRDGKDYLVQKTVAVCGAYEREVIGVSPSKGHQLSVCRSLSMLPAMTLALIKSVRIFTAHIKTRSYINDT